MTVGFSRTRGGDPMIMTINDHEGEFFPHTRGWSYARRFKCCNPYVFPAHAGVILIEADWVWLLHCFSRRRGGDPSIFSNFSLSMEFFPHTRGWSYPGYRNWTGFHVYFSRRRGGDPVDTSTSWTIPLFFPQTRGWSYRCLYSLYGSYVFPAEAGVIPDYLAPSHRWPSFSRTRGGDPPPIFPL